MTALKGAALVGELEDGTRMVYRLEDVHLHVEQKHQIHRPTMTMRSGPARATITATLVSQDVWHHEPDERKELTDG